MKVHPFPAILFSLVMFIMILIYNNPLYLLTILLFLVSLLIIFDNKNQMKSMLKFGLYTAILIIIINPVVSGAGRTIIYKSPKLAVIGRITISMEGIMYGVNMSIKLLCIMLIFTCYGALTDKDDTFTFFSKYAYKLTLTISMTVNILHRLKIEINRIKNVMSQRGVNFEQKNVIRKIKAYYPVLKVILISSLEGSISRAEALYSRGYGKGKRTSYENLKMDKVDKIYTMQITILLLILAFGIKQGFNIYNFYPLMETFNIEEIIYLALTISIMIIFLVCVRGCRKWKYSRLKI